MWILRLPCPRNDLPDRRETSAKRTMIRGHLATPRRHLYAPFGAPRTVFCIFLFNSELLPYSPALISGEEGGGANVKRQSQTSGP